MTSSPNPAASATGFSTIKICLGFIYDVFKTSKKERFSTSVISLGTATKKEEPFILLFEILSKKHFNKVCIFRKSDITPLTIG